MAIISQYSMVCQVPNAEPYTIYAYTGDDLTQVLGITQASLPDGHYGWIQECGDAVVAVSGQTTAAYADFRSNTAIRELSQQELPKQDGEADGQMRHYLLRDKLIRLSQLPPLLIEDGAYCGLIREARDVFIDGHFYACVAMCGISFERFQRDKARQYGATIRTPIRNVKAMLQKNKAISEAGLELCESMTKLRDQYAHGQGDNNEEDALESLSLMRSFIDIETSLMRGYEIINGVLVRRNPEEEVTR